MYSHVINYPERYELYEEDKEVNPLKVIQVSKDSIVRLAGGTDKWEIVGLFEFRPKKCKSPKDTLLIGCPNLLE